MIHSGRLQINTGDRVNNALGSFILHYVPNLRDFAIKLSERFLVILNPRSLHRTVRRQGLLPCYRLDYSQRTFPKRPQDHYRVGYIMATGREGFLNQTSLGGHLTEKSREAILCPGLPNTRFETFEAPLPYFVNAALNVSLAIATTLVNVVVLLAMRRVTSIRLPSKLLLCSLVLTDLGAGSIVQPQFAAFLFVKAMVRPGHVQCTLLKSGLVTGSFFTCVSMLTLTAISLDRYAALFFHLKYQQIVTTRRVCAALALIWMFSLFFASTSIWTYELKGRLVFAVAATNVLVVSFVYIKIFLCLRARQIQPRAPDQAQQQNTLNMARYRRTASSMAWVYVLFLICSVPFSCLSLVTEVVTNTALIVCLWEYGYTLVLLNSFLNPFFFCFRLPEIRTEVANHLGKLCSQISPWSGCTN